MRAGIFGLLPWNVSANDQDARWATLARKRGIPLHQTILGVLDASTPPHGVFAQRASCGLKAVGAMAPDVDRAHQYFGSRGRIRLCLLVCCLAPS